MKQIFFFLFAFGTPLVTLAHVKWFAQEIVPMPAYQITDPRVLLIILSGLVLFFIGIFLEHKISVPQKVTMFMERTAPFVLSLASIGFGLAFIIFTIQGFIFAPNLPAQGTLGLVMLGIQGIAGIMILLGFYERIGGFLILFLFILGIAQYGSFEMLDTLEMVGFAGYAMIVGRPKWHIADSGWLEKITHHVHAYGYPLLRIGTGVNLIVLGFTEKILAPSLTQNFLTTHHWNFLQSVGVSDYWFAFTAGSVEILFGIFFVFGLVTRMTTIALACFLVTTLYLLGPVELIGHLPHFSIALVLLVLGSGSRFVFGKK